MSSTKTISNYKTLDGNDGFRFAKLYIFAAIIITIAELIGSFTFNIGPGKIVLLPMIWALLIGAALGLAKNRLPAPLRIETSMQFNAAMILQPALLLFVAKLGLLVGSSLPQIVASGWALVFQEFGHFVGTIMFGLPLALLLGIKREAIGATFSVGREPSLAIIGEKYGMDSPEGRGVLAEYLTGTVFGAVFIAILAGFIASLNIFDPIALAMGSGVGSGSMMAAASGAIAAQQTPEIAKQVMTFAAASNLITTTIGTYFTLFISLPMAVWGYRVLEPILGRKSSSSTPPEEAKVEKSADHSAALGPIGIVCAWVLSAGLAMIGDWIARGSNPLESIPGMAIMLVAVLIGVLLNHATGKKIPAVCWVSLIAMALTSPICPWAEQISALTAKINFLALITPMLTFAGLSIAKDIPAFRRLGWRIVVVSFAANAGTFLGATIIAQFFKH
ncbi:DUF3100 domain-containing protein [Glaciimonas sp. PCH181]|uniref:DUF3100 domain-containing protein n=1 Tax=Glaciimonas sp. PCH181 TaxID=2133943 RepID=UPI000D383854|nr:DUF3100 domain-containing protein [Glaciimonas sp. PCH181]PUA17333.1 DUF3100 domain-containing protein [Glaciimonas sp. PCH181]